MIPPSDQWAYNGCICVCASTGEHINVSVSSLVGTFVLIHFRDMEITNLGGCHSFFVTEMVFLALYRSLKFSVKFDSKTVPTSELLIKIMYIYVYGFYEKILS